MASKKFSGLVKSLFMPEWWRVKMYGNYCAESNNTEIPQDQIGQNTKSNTIFNTS